MIGFFVIYMRLKRDSNYLLNKLRNELPAALHCHRVEDTASVYEACKQLAALEHISAYETKLLLTAACYHDTGFLKDTNGHEQISCEIARSTLSGYGYTEDEISRICGMIVATRIPQSPKNHLEEILADADLNYLGRDDFFALSNKLYLEWEASGKITGANWDQIQIDFFEKYYYFTKTALQLRLAKKHHIWLP